MFQDKKEKSSKKYQEFVSSTYDDLIDERKEVTQAILKCDCIPAGMELWPASNFSQWEVIKSVIDDSDYYLLIIAGKYGSEGYDENGNYISYTEMEYDYAVYSEKPVIALIHKYPEQLPGTKIELDNEKREKLKRFKEKVMNGHLVTFWTSISDVKTEAVLAIENAIKKCPTVGWIKASQRGSGFHEVHFYKINSLEDAQEAADAVSKGNVVVVNFEGSNQENSKRTMGFIVGSRYEAGGSIHKISNYIFLVLPQNIDIVEPMTNMLEEYASEEAAKCEKRKIFDKEVDALIQNGLSIDILIDRLKKM